MARPLAISPADLRGADAVIIGAPYAAGWTTYAGLDKREWLAGPKRVRQQSVRYASGYIQRLARNNVFETSRLPPSARVSSDFSPMVPAAICLIPSGVMVTCWNSMPSAPKPSPAWDAFNPHWPTVPSPFAWNASGPPIPSSA